MSTFFPLSSEPLDLALWPHEGTPLSFLVALRAHLDGFNPDRAQIEKNHARSVITWALSQIQAPAPDQYGAARRLFPGAYAVRDMPAMDEGANDESGEGVCVSWLAFAEPRLPGMVPTMAPDAHRARGTPVSAFAALVLQPGANAFPHLVVAPRCVRRRFFWHPGQ